MLNKIRNILGGDKEDTEKSTVKRRVISWSIQILVVLVVLVGINECQSSGLISRDAPAPGFKLSALDGSRVELESLKGKPVLLYFFAPWCPVCDQTSRNIQALRESKSEDEMAIYAVGLEYETEDDLRAFATEHELTVPILKGNRRTMTNFRVKSFPTIYILDEDGLVSDRMVGYTTEIGLRLRSL